MLTWQIHSQARSLATTPSPFIHSFFFFFLFLPAQLDHISISREMTRKWRTPLLRELDRGLEVKTSQETF